MTSSIKHNSSVRIRFLNLRLNCRDRKTDQLIYFGTSKEAHDITSVNMLEGTVLKFKMKSNWYRTIIKNLEEHRFYFTKLRLQTHAQNVLTESL